LLTCSCLHPTSPSADKYLLQGRLAPLFLSTGGLLLLLIVMAMRSHPLSVQLGFAAACPQVVAMLLICVTLPVNDVVCLELPAAMMTARR
jgi:hypothetical protein